MRIISKTKDYYDSASAYGIDAERIYLRENKDVTVHARQEATWSNRNNEVNFGKFQVIGFAGEIIPFQRHVLGSDEYIIYGEDAIKLEPFAKGWRQIRTEKDPIWVEDKYYKEKRHKWSWTKDPQEVYDELVNSKLLSSLFDEFEVPIWYTKGKYQKQHRLEIELNPVLKDLGFAKIKDAVTAFTQIDQFLGTRLVKDTEVDLPAGSNADLARSKGFDENSFKKEATKKKYGKGTSRNRI